LLRNSNNLRLHAQIWRKIYIRVASGFENKKPQANRLGAWWKNWF